MHETPNEPNPNLPAPQSTGLTRPHPSALSLGPGEDPAGLPQVVREVQDVSRPSSHTFWRRLLFVWFRVYKYESRQGRSSTLNLRLPLPVPLLGALFRQNLSWGQAFQFIEQSRRPEGVPPERFLESCMPLEFLRLYEGKNGKEELLVIGFD